MPKNRNQLRAQVPMSRDVYETLKLGTPESRADELVPHVLPAMNTKAAERGRRVFELPWVERVEDDVDPVVVHLIANTEPA